MNNAVTDPSGGEVRSDRSSCLMPVCTLMFQRTSLLWSWGSLLVLEVNEVICGPLTGFPHPGGYHGNGLEPKGACQKGDIESPSDQ